MDHYAGIDVSLECSSVCVVDASGKIVREGKVASEPEALIGWFGSLGLGLARIGLEAGPLSQWLYAAMREAGLAVELLETRHVRDAFKAMPVKTDRNDARGIAQLMRLGWFRPVHCKSLPAQEVRALLTARKLVQSKLFDVEMSLRGILRSFGLKVGPTTPKRFAGRIRELVAGQATLEIVAASLLAVHEVLLREFGNFEKRVRAMARDDGRTRLLMSAPGVGAIVALTYVSAIDDPARFKSSNGGRRAFRADAEEVPIGSDRHHGSNLEDRRQRRAHGALRGRPHHPDAAGQGFGAQELGREAGQARRHEEGEGRARAQACRDHASHVGRRKQVRLCRRRGLTRERSRVFGRVATPAVPKRSPLAGTMDQVRPLPTQWRTTTRS
jgi:transposase